MKKFFEGLPYKTKSNCEILYPSIKKLKKFNYNKKNQIIFTGKLNSSKGYDLFGNAIIKILNKYPKSFVYSKFFATIKSPEVSLSKR